MNKALLTRKEASAYLIERGFNVAITSLNKLASKGGGPPYPLFGGRVLYKPSDLLAWAKSRCIRKISTSDTGAPAFPEDYEERR